MKHRHRSIRSAIAAVAVAVTLGAAVPVPRAHAVQLLFTITGSTQMYTLGHLLAAKYMSEHPDVTIDVEPTSSALAFTAACSSSNIVGMSDVYIQDSQLRQDQRCADMQNVPVAISATTVVYNLPGKYLNQRDATGFTLVHPVRLTAQVVSDIYMGKVTHWNDPEIKSLNSGLPLPSNQIQVYNSAEPGGSGYVFNQWLDLSVPAWNKAVGGGLQPAWPRGSTGEPSSGAMAQTIYNTPYSIGFAGFDYAITYKLQAAALENAANVFLTPSLNGLSYAINKQLHLGMPHDFRRTFVTVNDPKAFNPACFEFFLVHKDSTNIPGASPAERQAVKDFLAWTIDSNHGQLYIEQIEFRKVGKKTQLDHGFVPVPDALRAAIAAEVTGMKV